MRIMFMGTPDISCEVLKALVSAGEEVVSVVTGEDKPRGRGKVMTPTPTRAYADEIGIDTVTPRTLRDDAFMSYLSKVDPDIIVVVAYGKILPKSVISYPKYGCINLHVSLLPKYRGAAPMQRAIMDGERETGVTVMQMDEGLDTGDILLSESFAILPDDDFERIHDRSITVGAPLLLRALSEIEAGTVKPIKQDDSLASYAKKVEKDDCKLDLSLSARRLDCIIRGVTPFPGAFVYLNGKMLKINRAEPIDKPGEVGLVSELSGSGDGYIVVGTGEGSLKVLSVIPEGKGKMTAGDLVRGRKIQIGDKLL
jgi:methionyl-tRNA formyltransferase